MGILQNSWFYDPPKIRRMLAYKTDLVERERLRRRLCTYALFAGCKCGRMLREGLGDKLCDAIVWENASKEFGDLSSASFPPDLKHLYSRIREEQPQIVIAFGKVAQEGVDKVSSGIAQHCAVRIIECPHPTARAADVLPKLRWVRRQLDQALATDPHPTA
jgi:hypothetical protein